MVATLQGHEGPVWQVQWAHPKFGVLLVSCSFDGSVLIHKETRPRDWTILHAARQLHSSSVNGLSIAPHEYGLQVAAASSDGRISVLKHCPDQTWSVDYLPSTALGVNAVSWAPANAYSSQEGEKVIPRLVSAGCDNRIQLWQCVEGQWTQDTTTIDTSSLQHTDWVRDVAWAPALRPNTNLIASCSEDGTVLLWEQTEAGGDWTPTLLHRFQDEPVWRVSWSVTGHMLAVSSGDSTVTMWKAGLDGKWTQMETVTDGQVSS